MEAVLAQRKRVRSPVGAGMFYPDDKTEILGKLRSFNLTNKGEAKAIIAPHGAWNYSGSLAADAFSCAIGRNIERVVILGPIHDKREKGLFLSNSHSFYTPLGDILVDQEISDELEFYGESFEINDIPHLGEHSIEVLLPFVKHCFPKASIVPILMGQPGAQYIYDLAQSLKAVITPVLDDTLIVVSCNLSCNKDERTARLLAEECLRLFCEKNTPALTSAILEGRLNACGGALVVSLLESGLLGDASCSAVGNLESAVSSEKNTVYYSGFSFV
ncbi:MAG: AmmeMemoRadiSam system protein B [Treponema sp.]|nr:AmmeMemoRadiSam system protein B [Treponema sp.]